MPSKKAPPKKATASKAVKTKATSVTRTSTKASATKSLAQTAKKTAAAKTAAKPVEAAKTARRRRPDEVKARILAAALNTFATHGFDGATVAMIAEDAAVKLSLLLYHFQSKELLWKACVEAAAARSPLLHIFENDSTEYATAKDKLRAVIRRVVAASAAEPNLHLLMSQEGRKPSERLLWLCETFLKKDYENLCDLIRAAQKEGAVRDVNPARLRYAILALSAVPFSVAAEYQYLTQRDAFSHAEVENAIEFIDHLVFL